VSTVDPGGPESGLAERPGLLGNLAQRLQDGVRATIVALRQSHAQRLAAIVESSDDAILSVDLDGTIATWNQGAEALLGYEAEEAIGRSVLTLIPPEREGEEPEILRRVARGEHVQHYETVRRHKNGSLIPVSLSVSPILDASSVVIGASKIARDISARRHFEQVLAKRAEEQAALYEFTDRLFRAGSASDVYEAALDAIIRALGCERASILLFDAAGIMKFVAWRGLSDGYRQAVEGHSPWTRDTINPAPLSIDDVEVADLEASLKATVKAEGIGALAFVPLTARGELVGKFMTYYEAPHRFSVEELDLAVTIARQLGFALERLRSEEAKEMLLAESRHRIKNILATVQAIAGQSLRPADGEDGLQSFLARLRALAEAHDVLTTENWDRAPLRQVVDRALKPFHIGGHGRLNVAGPDVWLPAQTSLMLTMCLHELATNAAKYGALSNSSGHVHVRWESLEGENRRISLSWQENGGPPVTPPTRKGFGSLLIESSGIEGNLDFRPKGLYCQFHFPI
jgi:PAS domain S-box-containing protein